MSVEHRTTMLQIVFRNSFVIFIRELMLGSRYAFKQKTKITDLYRALILAQSDKGSYSKQVAFCSNCLIGCFQQGSQDLGSIPRVR